jgi:hypothetical protein
MEALNPVLFADQGLLALFFADNDLTGLPIFSRIDSSPTLWWDPANPDVTLPSTFGMRWTGNFMNAADGGTRTLVVTTSGGVRVSVGGTTLIDEGSAVPQPAPGAGDMDCDGVVTADDLWPFLTAITNGRAAFEASYPAGDYDHADLNGDGFMNAGDINPMVEMVDYGFLSKSYTATYSFAEGSADELQLDFFNGGGVGYVNLEWFDTDSSGANAGAGGIALPAPNGVVAPATGAEGSH